MKKLIIAIVLITFIASCSGRKYYRANTKTVTTTTTTNEREVVLVKDSVK